MKKVKKWKDVSCVSCHYFLFLHIIFSPFHSFTFVSLPYQGTNRYAVVGVMPLTHSWTVIRWSYPQTHILIGVFGMEYHTFEAKQRYMEKALCWLPHSGCWIGIHFFTQLISLSADCIHRINILYNAWWENKKHLLCELPRSGWSVGRAGLGVKRPTLPKRCILSFKAVGLGLFPFNTLLRWRMGTRLSS